MSTPEEKGSERERESSIFLHFSLFFKVESQFHRAVPSNSFTFVKNREKKNEGKKMKRVREQGFDSCSQTISLLLTFFFSFVCFQDFRHVLLCCFSSGSHFSFSPLSHNHFVSLLICLFSFTSE